MNSSRFRAPGVNVPTLTVINRQRTRPIHLGRLQEIAAALLADVQLEGMELDVVLVAGPEMKRLNERHLGHAGTTDVLAFDYADPGSPSRLRGEIVICVDEAVGQAKKFRTRWPSEVVRYLVHGVLHLMGQEDRRPADRRRMKRQEDRRLRALARRFSFARLARRGKLGV